MVAWRIVVIFCVFYANRSEREKIERNAIFFVLVHSRAIRASRSPRVRLSSRIRYAKILRLFCKLICGKIRLRLICMTARLEDMLIDESVEDEFAMEFF